MTRHRPPGGEAPRRLGPTALARVLGAVALRPDLWPTAALQVRVTACPGWWRHWPPRPMPAAGYLAFRLESAYGSARPIDLVPADVVHHLEWCRDQRRLSR